MVSVGYDGWSNDEMGVNDDVRDDDRMTTTMTVMVWVRRDDGYDDDGRRYESNGQPMG